MIYMTRKSEEDTLASLGNLFLLLKSHEAADKIQEKILHKNRVGAAIDDPEYRAASKKLDKWEHLIEQTCKDLGIEFQCTDYGDAYCLSLIGLRTVIYALMEL